MKKLLLIIMIVMLSLYSNAQFTKASLQATGLTCAMCNNAINKALQKISFVASVKSDIKNSAFNIVFKQNTEVDIDALKNAVEDAGFSVGSLKLTGTFKEMQIVNDKHVQIGDKQFCFLNVNSQTLNGETIITVVDKNFMTAKEFKKISSSTKMNSLQTGKASSCCGIEGVSANT
ncbi:MAG TPA: heavy-metal-associated domain-containing protein, partial [Chitinophagaceae bacterium]|nr:heavy-metal-associated domain-containing protein [Chitinophagaceae bacterium]